MLSSGSRLSRVGLVAEILDTLSSLSRYEVSLDWIRNRLREGKQRCPKTAQSLSFWGSWADHQLEMQLFISSQWQGQKLPCSLSDKEKDTERCLSPTPAPVTPPGSWGFMCPMKRACQTGQGSKKPGWNVQLTCGTYSPRLCFCF